ncbi:hypothetical protein KUH32_14575 [Thalassococcus sp. CAU 1522]|uniref:Uncharacterized protein n=1 Tax=Thalassococcus arenae TaxID=2851652 RepID=A0ABS6NB19_9RHOB|nr:hypothetical protein [Thalassococcus arenae]MBV2360988.1 hypothetical protein [Thalassococcus arenae]
MQNAPDVTFLQALQALTEFPAVAHTWLGEIRDILGRPDASPQDGAELARIVALFQSDIDLAETNNRIVLAHIHAAASMQKGPRQ